ncbi:MAG: DUF3828 domain-containing protein [Elusimicrobia bacterium]|nr:DUF3828 domain-containing protein [Elusimicrobiota bacterium]
MDFFETLFELKPFTVISLISTTIVFFILFSIFFVLDLKEEKANVIDESKKNTAISDNTYVNAEDMLFDFYNQYLSSSINETERHALIKKYCTNNMLETLDILYSFDDEEGFIIGIDYDPFLNAQDFFPIENIKIEETEKNKYKISWNDTNNIMVMLNVIEDNNVWKIDSIDIDRLEQIKKDVADYWKSKNKPNPKRFSE